MITGTKRLIIFFFTRYKLFYIRTHKAMIVPIQPLIMLKKQWIEIRY